MTERRRIRFRGMAWHGMAFMLMAGCVPKAPSANEVEAVGSVPTLIDADQRTHHFGPVIAQPGLKLSHVYRLVNSTDETIKIVDVVNQKPCCGAITLSRTTLGPQETADLELTLSINADFGGVVHQAVVVTDPPAREEIILRTSATAYPALRIEPVTNASDTIILGTAARDLEFHTIAMGTVDEPPIDLDALTLASSLPSHWLGPKETTPAPRSLTAYSRTFSITLTPDGEPGDRRDSLVLRDGESSILDQAIAWTVVAAVKAEPKVLIVRPERRDYRILVRSSDQTPFCVTAVEVQNSSIVAEAESTEARPIHIIAFHVTESLSDQKQRSAVTVRTDHPAQPLVSIPVVVLQP